MNVLKKTAPGKKRSMSDTEEKLSKLDFVSAASPTRENAVESSWIRGVRGRKTR
jgi:ornithine cyclodeaminase/alanine dehydrogenase-like protein (mu-crystallin family)